MATLRGAYRNGDRLWVNQSNETFRMATATTNARMDGKSAWITVGYDDGTTSHVAVSSCHRPSPEFEAWSAAFADRKDALARLQAVLYREGFVFAGAACTRTPEWARYDAASKNIRKTGAVVFAKHPYGR